MMKTAARATDVTWVVDVEDVRDLERDMPGYRQRFTFYGEDAAERAWKCWTDAEQAGFKTTVDQVRHVATGGEQKIEA